MANIDLRNIYRQSRDKVSPVDSHIILNKAETDSELYSDLKLDLELEEIKERPLHAKESTKDLLKITNLEAVRTSLQNILNTTANSRLLNPDLDFNLSKYLFERLNGNIAYFIGYELCTRISMYEPRVSIEHVNIELDFDNTAYNVSLAVKVPSLNTVLSLSAVLNSEGYSFT